MAEAFEELVKDLNDEKKAEFFEVLHESGISRNDLELAKLLRVFHFYKSYYEEIPKSVQKAAVRIGRIRDEVEKMADRVAGDVGDLNKSISNIYSSVSETADKASRRILNNIEKTLEPLSDAVKRALPSQIADIEESTKAFKKVVKTNRLAAAEIQKNTKYMQWRHYRAFTLAVFFVILGLWAFTHYKYEQRFKEQCAVIAGQYGEHRDILLTLAKSNRRLELTTSPDGTSLLVMNNAKAWVSTNKQGVIEFK